MITAATRGAISMTCKAGPEGQNAFVSQDLVIGRAIAVVWPFDRRHRLPIPDTFETVPSGNRPAPDISNDHRRT